MIPHESMKENLSTDIRLEAFDAGDCVRSRKNLDAIREEHKAHGLLD